MTLLDSGASAPLASSHPFPEDSEVMADFDRDFVNESDMESFRHALSSDDPLPEHDPLAPIGSPSSIRSHRVRKVSAMSDFAPIQVRVRKKKRGRPVNPHKREWLFVLVRWPLLIMLFLFIGLVFGAYVTIRQCVNAWEKLFAWRGRKGRLRQQMRNAKTFLEWKRAAEAMDDYLSFDSWKYEDEDSYYDWRLVKRVHRSLRESRHKHDARSLMNTLSTCLRANFAGTESSRLYSETFFGTKGLIEDYLDEVQASIRYLRKSTGISLEEKRQFFKSCNINFGSSALCLSGGASFGYYHFGVAKALLDADLLPRVVAGTSAGGLVAALVCTRTDEELRSILVPELADKIRACEEPFSVWFSRFRSSGARFDTIDWARKSCYFTRGSLTFKEAWLRTGRVLNISVIPFDQHSPTKLLNYLTAPDTVIWSALLASAAVPGILNPVVLMQKTPNGSIIPWSWGSRFKDGSLRVDIPLQALNLYFNVTHPIVSQVNPHVHLFFFAPRGSPGKPVAHTRGKGWRGGFVLSAAEQWLKLELTKNFKFIRDLELLPQLLGQDWSSVFLQRFDGAVTIWPRTRFMDWFRILSDPDRDELARMIRVGQFVTWPKIHIIENRMRLEREILRGRQAVRANAVAAREKPTVDTEPIFTTRAVTPRSGDAMNDLPIESEAERDFARGSQRFFKRSKTRLDKGLSSPPAAEGPLRHRTAKTDERVKSIPFPAREEGTADDEGHGSPASSPDTPGPSPVNQDVPKSFLARLRSRSLTAFPAFRPKHGEAQSPASSVYERQDEGWSSDSSSDLDVVDNWPITSVDTLAGMEEEIELDTNM